MVQSSEMKRRVTIMLSVLSLQFVLGMFLNLFGVSPDEATVTHPEPFYSVVAFGLHSFIGLMLLVGSIAIIILSEKSKKREWKKYGRYGLLSILLAFVGGILTVVLKDTASELSSLGMSLGFLLSFIFYGKLYMLLQK